MWRHPRFPQAGVAPSATRLPQQRCARSSSAALGPVRIAPLGPRHVSSGAFGEAFGEGGGTEHPPLRPGVARHSFRF